jgi:MSHA pilin protein MshC
LSKFSIKILYQNIKLKRGFTTIELVTVIIIVAILAVNVLPHFDGTASYEAHTHRAQLISALRLTQQRAMQQTNTTYGYCHEIIFDDIKDRYDIPNRIDCTPNVPVFPLNWQADATGHAVSSRYQITFNIDGALN